MMEQNLSHLSVLKYVEGFALGYFTLKVQKLPQRQETHPEPTPGDLPSCQQGPKEACSAAAANVVLLTLFSTLGWPDSMQP